MLNIERIDIKTGLTLQVMLEGTQQPQIKPVENSYLEHWLETHQLEDSKFYVGRLHKTVNDKDRLQLEAEDKVAVFSNGKDIYFTDPVTAGLMTEGDSTRGIDPIYAGDSNSPHNFVAYGSLVASDGNASTSVPSARILVIDNRATVDTAFGREVVVDKTNKALSKPQKASIYKKMGDGTTLLPRDIVKQLITPEERDSITKKAFQKADISTTDITSIGRDIDETDTALASAEHILDKLADRTVSQFRAATPSLSGIIKGTLGSSEWCDRLGVDAIISVDCIKGADSQLLTPGIHEVDNFWINRKSDAQYGNQGIGPQVKDCIPNATLNEFNPRIEAQVEELSAIAGDYTQLSQHYKDQHERKRLRTVEHFEGRRKEEQPERSDWLYDVLEADKLQQLSRFSRVNDGLKRHLQGEWRGNALQGVYLPSAMAQHHGEMKPWEVCNKNLEHGTTVACFRSPLSSGSAMGVLIVNNDAIEASDPEAFTKDGVAYFHPWTEEIVLITDNDGDQNPFLKGYVATVDDLPQQVRQQMASVEELPLPQQYEAWRSLASEMIDRMEAGQEERIVAGEYPLAVKEVIELNAPDVKPPQVNKQPKVKFPWEEGETRSAATWRAAQTAADNPTGLVANSSMTLRALAIEMRQDAPPKQKEGLLRQVASHYTRLLRKAEKRELFIPNDVWLRKEGFKAYDFSNRMRDVASVGKRLDQIKDPLQRQRLVKNTLDYASQILTDFVDGPNAANLQAAVDTPKNYTRPNPVIQNLAKALPHKPDNLRKTQKLPSNYKGKENQVIDANIDGPVAKVIRFLNEIYQKIQKQLPELPNEAFKDLFPKDCTPEQERKALEMPRSYNQLIETRRKAQERLQERHPEDQQPTLLLTAGSDRQVVVQGIKDDELSIPIWRTKGVQPDWEITVRQNFKAESESTRFPTTLTFTDAKGETQTESLGYISQESVAQHGLKDRLQRSDNTLSIRSPHVQAQPPFAQENNVDALLAIANKYAETAVEQIPEEERPAYLSALWRESDGMGFGLKHFTDLVTARLSTIPEISITGVHYQPEAVQAIPEGECTAKFSEYTYQTKAGIKKTSPSISIITSDGEEMHLGAVDARSMHLPIGTTVTANITVEESGKAATMQVLDVVASEVGEATIDEAIEEHTNDQENNGYTPTRQQLLQWARTAINRGDEEKAEEIIEIGRVLKLAYSEDTGDLTNKPPLDYSHPSVTISASDREEMTQTLVQPTSKQLSQWMATAEKRRDTEQALQIIQIKSRLEATYKEGTGNLFGDLPEDYSHPDVTLNQSQQGEMAQAILESQASESTTVNSDSMRQQVEIG